MRDMFLKMISEMIAKWLVFQALTGLFGGGFAAKLMPSMAGFQTGIRRVPERMAALLHPGEAVVPAPIAQFIRGGEGGMADEAAPGRGGGVSVAVQMDVIDPESVTEENLQKLAQKIKPYIENETRGRV